MLKLITPKWPAPAQIKAYTTTRLGGYSQAPYKGLNLAYHVGDDPKIVLANRAALIKNLKIPSQPVWLNQVHGIQTVTANSSNIHCTADAAFSTKCGQVCIVMTADCLPVLFCNRAGTRVAAAHAGWRGLVGGVLEACIQHLDIPIQEILVWLGPAIGPKAFEVGEEVRESFINFLPQATEAFTAHGHGHWLADLYLLAHQRLAHQGISAVFGGDFCTYTDTKHFYSYRRNKITGRMASLIWISN